MLALVLVSLADEEMLTPVTRLGLDIGFVERAQRGSLRLQGRVRLVGVGDRVPASVSARASRTAAAAKSAARTRARAGRRTDIITEAVAGLLVLAMAAFV